MKNNKMILVIVCVIILAIIGGLVFYMLRSNNTNDTDDTDVNNKDSQTNTQNNVENNSSTNYINEFASISNETLESMDTQFSVKGTLENPSVSQVSYVWNIKEGVTVKGTINSEGIVRSVELVAPDSELYNKQVKFDSDLNSLQGKSNLTYEEVKAKCGNVDGTPIRISNGKVNTYVWVSSDYKLTVTIGTDNKITSFVGRAI